MITHDVDEAILLADRILLMTNGPYARIGESVKVDIPRPRDRTSIIRDPGYYPIRNHLVDFLVMRSKELAGGPVSRQIPEGESGKPDGYVRIFPEEVNPARNSAGSSSGHTVQVANQ
jgi:nitrate/nitrite transport system ATP-binding protein